MVPPFPPNYSSVSIEEFIARREGGGGFIPEINRTKGVMQGASLYTAEEGCPGGAGYQRWKGWKET